MENKNYQKIHSYIRLKKKNIVNCENCGEQKKLDCALIHGKEHEKNEENYICLCRKCHYKYDHPKGIKHTKESKIKIGLASKKRIKENGVSNNFIYSRKNCKISKEQKQKMSKAKEGEKHPQSKLTEKDVLYVLNSKESPTKLAKEFNVTYRTIANIKSRKTWKNLD